MKLRMPPVTFLLGVAGALVAVLSWQAGVRHGARTQTTELQQQLLEVQQAGAQSGQEYEKAIADVRAQRNLSEQTNKALLAQMQVMQDELHEAEAAMRLYDGIENNTARTGLLIDSVSRTSAGASAPASLDITLVQARGRNRVTGHVTVALVGEFDGESGRLVLQDAAAKPHQPFDFRFFQTLNIPLPEKQMNVDIVEIEVVPVGKKHKSFRTEMAWTGIPVE